MVKFLKPYKKLLENLIYSMLVEDPFLYLISIKVFERSWLENITGYSIVISTNLLQCDQGNFKTL